MEASEMGRKSAAGLKKKLGSKTAVSEYFRKLRKKRKNIKKKLHA